MLTEDDVRRIIREEMGSSVMWAPEFKSSLASWMEISGMRLPISQIDGTYVVADTVDGLGPGVHGRTGVIRGGTTPFDYLKVTYDAEYGKWVSDPFVIMTRVGNLGTDFTTTSASYVPVTDTIPIMYPCQSWEDAGLRAQFRHQALLRSDSGSNTATVKLLPVVGDIGGTSVSSGGLSNPDAELAVTSSTGTFVASSWVQKSTAFGLDLIWAELQLKVSAGTATLSQSVVLLRWVSA